MNSTVRKLMQGNADNHMLPFFWQHGEDETTLREYMKAIYEANCRAVCVESRPHPDFAGPKWWQDMDIILDEARKRDMKVWILDDKGIEHRDFPLFVRCNLILRENPVLVICLKQTSDISKGKPLSFCKPLLDFWRPDVLAKGFTQAF